MINCYRIKNNVWAFVDVYPYGERYKARIVVNCHEGATLDEKEAFNIDLLETAFIGETPEEVVKLFEEYFKE